MHDPKHATKVSERRKLGGYRRRRETAVTGASDLESLDNLSVPQWVLDIALLETLSIGNSLNRPRTLKLLGGHGQSRGAGRHGENWPSDGVGRPTPLKGLD